MGLFKILSSASAVLVKYTAFFVVGAGVLAFFIPESLPSCRSPH